MKHSKSLSLVALSLFLSLAAQSQITLTQVTANDAVQNVLVGSGVAVGNIQAFTTNPNAIGTFTNGTSSGIGLNYGVYLTSGLINNGQLNMPANSANMSQANGGGSDPQLASIATAAVNDAARIQFDFTPAGDTLKFRYIFASEEYPEFVGSTFNDVFGFFLTGPNPLGGNYNNTNIALIPGTATPVAINNVNAGSNAQYFVVNTNGTQFRYDGYTVPLTAIAPVIPCSTYTIKLAVGDVGDTGWDSGVFLEANSFGTGAVNIQPTYNYSSAVNDTLIYEGCSDVTLNFVRDGVIGQADTVPVVISGSATNGVDYTFNGGLFPNQIIFAPGQSNVVMTLTPQADGIIEGNENVTFTITNVNACGDTVISSVSFTITDVLPMDIDAGPDRLVCPGVPQTFTPVITGGVPPYTQTYWFLNTPGNILGTALINYVPQSSGMYIYTATNGCNANETVYDTVMVTIGPPQFALAFDVDSVSCFGTNDGAINMIVVGQTPPFSYQWTPGNITTEDLSNLGPGTFNVTVTDAFGCQVSGSATVFEPSNIPINISDKFVCAGSPINVNPNPINGVSYTWSPPQYFDNPTAVSPTFTGVNAGPGLDTVSLSVIGTSPGACGQDDFKIYITPLPPVQIMSPGFDTTALCPGDTIFLTNTANSAGFPPVTGILWSTGASSSPLAVTSPATYWLEHTNNAGCKFRDSVQVVPLSPPLLYADSVRYICGNQPITLSALGGEPGDSYLWSTGATTDTITVNSPDTYTLIVTNDCGSDTVSTQVVQIPTVTPQAMPNIFTPNGDGVNDIYNTQDLFANTQIFNVQVFNRWGAKMYETGDKSINWKPKNISDGVYFMAIIYTDCNNEQQKLGHTVTVTTK